MLKAIEPQVEINDLDQQEEGQNLLSEYRQFERIKIETAEGERIERRFIYYNNAVASQLNRASSAAEKIIILRRELKNAEQNSFLPKDLSYSYDVYIESLRSSLRHFEETLQLEKQGLQKSQIERGTENEQIKAYNRIVEIFEKQTFWSGSLTDFVHVMDTLAMKGYLKTNEFEEPVVKSLQQQSEENDKPRKMKTEAIKTIKKMPSKKKS